MRSLLFVPGDDPGKLQKGLQGEADALVLDLEDSVAPANKEAARRHVLTILKEQRRLAERPRLFVRINALESGLAEGDLDVVMTGGPDGIVLPKAAGSTDVTLLSARLAVREALHGQDDGATEIVAIATESAAAVFKLGSYVDAGPRLTGLAWGAEDLSADTGAHAVRADGAWTAPCQLVRNLCLLAATAAGASAIDTVHTDFRDLDGLAAECKKAARDGFDAKLAIHPDQVPIINAAFTPTPDAVARAERIVAAFADADTGVTSLDGNMLDVPHLKAAKRLLARAGRSTG